jgi:hypothetical protein
MIRRRAWPARIATKVGNHGFPATGITANLKNGGTLEKAASMANHASTRTTQLYDRRHRDEPRRDRKSYVLIAPFWARSRFTSGANHDATRHASHDASPTHDASPSLRHNSHGLPSRTSDTTPSHASHNANSPPFR